MGGTNNMDNEHPNPFIAHHQQQEAEIEKHGLNDINPAYAAIIKIEANTRIRFESITDEDEIIKVYAEVKQQYLEYLRYMKESRKP
jgi:hypothetical protein